MDDPSIKKRLIDFGTDDHEYDEVQELPEESSNPTAKVSQGSNNTGDNNNIDTPSSSADVGGPSTSVDTPPELPPPKQKSVKNSKNKQKQKANKSKIPRSPSLASSLSSLASSFSGSHSHSNNNNSNNNNNVPPQTPPLPTSYQQQNKKKAKHMNGADNDGGASATPMATAPTTTTTTTTASNVNNNKTPTSDGDGNISNNTNTMETTSGSSGNRRPTIQITPIPQVTTPTTPNPASPKNFQYLTLTVRKDENGYGMKVSGDNPVFVESVKPGGAAQIAGLVANDMILKVNGQEVRLEKHPTVVNLIKG
ncbi:hypothetical protein ACLKA7_014310 [Drosophila subpalustris]